MTDASTTTASGTDEGPVATARTLDPMAVALRGTQFIEASAGTGKTYTIATLFVRLVVENGLSVDAILVVTFTEAAASELRDRIRRRLADVLRALDALESAGETDALPPGCDPAMAAWLQGRASSRSLDRGRLRAALQMFDEAAISTIHGFCHRVLHDSAFETGVAFETELIANQRPLLDQAVRDYWGTQLYGTDARFARHILGKGLLPPKLFALAAITSAHPELPLLPAAPADADQSTPPDEAPFVEAFGTARELWLAHREDIVGMLRAHPGMHKTYYKPVDMERWFEAADGFFFAPTPSGRLTFAGLEWMRQSKIATKANKKYRDSGEFPKHAFFSSCEALVSAAIPLRRDLARRTMVFKRGLASYVTTELPLRKQEAGVQSFDDLLQGLDRALRRRRGGKALADSIRERYQAALIDEFQDTDPLQFRIFHTIYGRTPAPMLLIGDPKQAIYGFRGADVFAYLDAARDVPASRRHTLDTNWRSDPGLLAAIEHLFEGSRPFLLDGIDFVPVKARPGAQDMLHRDGEPLAPFELALQRRGPGVRTAKKTTHIMGEWARDNLPRGIAHDIHASLHSGVMLGDRPLRAGDIAVLSRTNAQAQQVQAALRDLGIPGVVYGDASVYDTREADEFERVLAAVAEPTARSLVRAALTTELLGVTGDQLEAMADDDEAWDTWVQLFRRWHELWVSRSFIRMQRALMSDLSLGKRLLALADGERRMTNLRHLTELLHEAASRDHLGPAGLRHWLAEQRTSEQFANDAVKLRLERDDEAVQLITIHRSKGLEYPVVYCPYLWGADELRRSEIENLKFHDVDDGNTLKLDISDKPGAGGSYNRPPNVEQAQFETTAESLRLLYVALTRARHRCVVTWGAFDRFHYSALAFLLHGKRFGETTQGVADGLRKATDDELYTWLQERKHATWDLTELGGSAAGTMAPAAAPQDAASLEARTPRSSIDRLYRTTSFTGIVAAHGHVDLSPGHDRDQALRDRTQHEARPSVTTAEEATVRLAGFPRGAHVGNFFHEVLEHVPFDADDHAIEARVTAGLRGHGVGESGLAETAVAAVRDVLTCPLTETGVRLCDLPPQDRLAELGFTMPVATALTDATGVGAALDRSSLRRALLTDPTGLPEGYADHLLGLDFIPIRGFLRGFIDLVFVREGKWFVVDYKTNDLGPHPSDYARPHMDRVMAHEHYVLQYHLYTVALCRHLRLRVPGFDYERDFGGALYLFLRGMSPQHDEPLGIYAERPPLRRIQALDALLGASPSVSPSPGAS